MVQYHVTLNAQGYMLDLDRYVKRVREPFAGKQSTGAYGVADLRGPEQVLVISDWSGGEGHVQHDLASPGGYRAGSGLDGARPVGGLRLGPRGSTGFAMAEDWGRPLAVYDGTLIVSAPSGYLYSYDGSTFGVIQSPGFPSTCAEVYLGVLYVGNATNGQLASWDGTTWTAAAATAGGPITTLRTHYRQAAQYLYIGADGAGSGGTGRAYYWDGSVLSSGQFDFEEQTPYASFILGGRLFFVASDPTNLRWGIYSVDDGAAGGAWRAHARLTGGYGIASAVLGDTAYIADAVGGRIWAFDGDDVRLVTELSSGGTAYAGQLRGIATWRGALWVGVRDGSGVGLLRYDGVGWTRPVAGLVGTDPETIVPYQDQLWVGVVNTGGAGVRLVNPLTFGGSGTRESGLIAFGLPGVSKLLRSVTIVCAAIVSPQTITVEYRLEDDGGWATLGTLSTVGATTATYSFPADTTCRQMALRLTLTGTAGASTSPTVYQAQVRYVPRPAVTREWELGVILEGTSELPLVTLDGASESLTGAQLTAALWSAAGALGPLTLVDLDGASYAVYVQDVREEIGKLSQRRGYQRLGLVKLVEAA